MTAQHVVPIAGGQVGGARSADGVVSFRGIPYALAPTGLGRFQGPQPPLRWDGVRPATAFGPIPPQPDTSFPGISTWRPGDGDDILTVNVWRPEQPGTGRPVLGWISGGSYTNGCADMYDPSALVRAGLVVVTFNYRVGFDGFGHVPGAPDNRGLLDQIAALEWVRDNIFAFGGDPGNVTVAGQSSGGGSVVTLPAMPAAHGLFSRGIALSVPCEYFSVGMVDVFGRQVAEAAGVTYDVNALAEVEPGRMIAAAGAVLGSYRDQPGLRRQVPTLFSPVVDGDTLPTTPLAAVGGIDLLLCHTVDEFRLFSVTGGVPAVTTDAELADLAAVGLTPADLDRYRATAYSCPGSPGAARPSAARSVRATPPTCRSSSPTSSPAARSRTC
jgi:para-nitrobenzyl esterase